MELYYVALRKHGQNIVFKFKTKEAADEFCKAREANGYEYARTVEEGEEQ